MELLGEVHVQKDRECHGPGHSFAGLLLHILTNTVVIARIRRVVNKETKVVRKVKRLAF